MEAGGGEEPLHQLANWLLVADDVSEPEQSAFVPFVFSSPGGAD